MNTFRNTTTRALLAFALLATTMTITLANESATAKTRETLKSWVDAEQVLSGEHVAWREEQAVIKDLISVLQQETATLQEAISESKVGLSQADEARDALLKQRKQMQAQRKLINTFLTKAETQVRDLRKYLPDPLLKKLEPLYTQLPSDANNTSLSLSERMQQLLAIVDTIRAFDRKLSVHREMRPLENGKLQEITTLYIGLAQAFYLSSSDAGLGYPSQSGWTWESHEELANEIEQAIDMIEGGTHAIDYVSFPLNITEVAR